MAHGTELEDLEHQFRGTGNAIRYRRERSTEKINSKIVHMMYLVSDSFNNVGEISHFERGPGSTARQTGCQSPIPHCTLRVQIYPGAEN